MWSGNKLQFDRRVTTSLNKLVYLPGFELGKVNFLKQLRAHGGCLGSERR
jgi:hypothetical protein